MKSVRALQLEFNDFARDTGEPGEPAVRVVTILIELLKGREVDFAWYERRFERKPRVFARDIQHLRKIGDELGIRIGRKREGRVRLEAIDGKNVIGEARSGREDLLRAMAWALGPPAAHALGADTAAEPSRDRFLLFALPRLVEGTRAAQLFEMLEAAHVSRARVRLRYVGRFGDTTVRVVEPYRVLAHGGRYFLVAYDTAPRKGWRYFALDKIDGVPARAGTFAPRPIPAQYLTADAVGLIQGGAATEVTVRFSPVVAGSVTSRQWQRGQRVKWRADGSSDVTLIVNDVDEAVRWAFGFGAEATVIAPARAVAIAEEMARALGLRYSKPATPLARRAGTMRP